MFKEPERHFPTGFWWWVVAFATAMALSNCGRVTTGTQPSKQHSLLLVVQAMTQGRPVGWFRVAQWSPRTLAISQFATEHHAEVYTRAPRRRQA
jgi:hypothetical protein